MKSKLTDNDPRLTAYALGELSRDEVEEVSRMLDANENRLLKREVEGIDSLGIILANTLSSGGAERFKLKASQRDSIFRSAKAPTADDVSSTHQSAWRRPVLVILGAAALVTISFLVLDNVDSNEDVLPNMAEVSFPDLPEDELHRPIQPSSAVWDGEASSSMVSSHGGGASHIITDKVVGGEINSGKLTKLVEHDWVNRADQAVTRMPLACGKASWNLVKHSIEVGRVIPDKDAIRVEEIINAFNYDIPIDLELSFVIAGVELVQCPWNDENLIAVILVKNKHEEITQVEAAVTFSEAVEEYRLVGYAEAEVSEENVIAPAKINMAAGDVHVVLYELKTVADLEVASDVFSLNLRTASLQDEELVNDDKNLNIQYSNRAWIKAEQDVQFALIAALWSQVLSESVYTSETSIDDVKGMISHFELSGRPSDEQSQSIAIMKKALDLIR